MRAQRATLGRRDPVPRRTSARSGGRVADLPSRTRVGSPAHAETWHAPWKRSSYSIRRVRLDRAAPPGATLLVSSFTGVRMIRLRHLSGSLQGRTANLTKSALRLGRAPDCDVKFDHAKDPKVSSHHAELLLEDGDWIVIDTGSTNGT